MQLIMYVQSNYSMYVATYVSHNHIIVLQDNHLEHVSLHYTFCFRLNNEDLPTFRIPRLVLVGLILPATENITKFD